MYNLEINSWWILLKRVWSQKKLEAHVKHPMHQLTHFNSNIFKQEFKRYVTYVQATESKLNMRFIYLQP